MKLTKIIVTLATATLLTGCAATRTISDVGLGAGGAALAGTLSHGNVVATAAGAAGGVLVSEAGQALAKSETQKAYVSGYDKGRSDAVKQQYWLYVDMQKPRDQAGSLRLYEVQLPEQTIDGVTFKPTTKYLRIEE
jgi:hypothetical protein